MPAPRTGISEDAAESAPPRGASADHLALGWASVAMSGAFLDEPRLLAAGILGVVWLLWSSLEAERSESRDLEALAARLEAVEARAHSLDLKRTQMHASDVQESIREIRTKVRALSSIL